jgi:hypothetical protein
MSRRGTDNQGHNFMANAVGAELDTKTVRFVALDRQHPPIKHELQAASSVSWARAATRSATNSTASRGVCRPLRHCPLHRRLVRNGGAVADDAGARDWCRRRGHCAGTHVHRIRAGGRARRSDAGAVSRGPWVFEDAAQAHGARYRGERVGPLGACAAFSFYPTKNLGALGDGGAVCTNDDIVAAKIRRLRNLGQRAKAEHVELGYNERLDGLQAALLRVKLQYLDD